MKVTGELDSSSLLTRKRKFKKMGQSYKYNYKLSCDHTVITVRTNS